MEQVHGVDVSWMTKASPKDRTSKSSRSSPKPSPALSQPRNIPQPSQDPRRPRGTPDNKNPPPQHNGHPSHSPTNGPVTPRRSSPSRSIENKNALNGTPPQQRRNSWFSNISAKFSGSANSPPAAAPNQHHSSHHLHQKESQLQHNDNQAPPCPSQPQLPGASPSTDDTVEPIPPKLNPTRNAVLQHAAAKPEGNSPYTPAPPRSGQAGILGVLRRLSSSGGSSVVNTKLGNGLVERKILNVDQNRERCKIAELKDARLRRVSFCVDVEIAPMPRCADGDTPQPKTIDKTQKKRLTERTEGNALKNPQASEGEKEAEEAASEPNGESAANVANSAMDAVQKVNDANDGAINESISIGAEKETTKKKEKKKKSEGGRKARKEKRRRLAEDNGSVPMEIHYDSSDSSSEARSGTATPSSSCHPTTNPARIYRRCCQLRETPILKKITEQLMDSCNTNITAGTVAKLDLTDYYLQLPDLITLGDYLAVVPVKEIILENSGLNDEGLRVILAGLLAAKMPSTSRRRKPKHELVESQGGIVERLVLKNNKLGPDGWKHISLFLYKCRSLKSLDISHIPFPRQAPAVKNSTLPNGVQIPRSISDVFSRAVAERLGGSTLEMVNIGETEPSMEQLGLIIDGMIKCGVRRLGLAHNSLDADGIKHVVRYLAAGVCEGLDLGGNDLSEHIETLASSLDENHLVWALSLASCGLTPSGLGKMLPALAKLKNLRFIDLSHNQDLFQSKPSALGLLRRYLPKMDQLKRIHLQDVKMSSEQAIALVEVLPEVRNLAHINLLGNSELVQLADAKTEEAQEEACALYASLMAAARISSSLICVDIEVPKEDAGEIVKAMAKQVVAYCLRNLERLPDTNIGSVVASAMSETQAEVQECKDPAYPDVLVHLVGRDALDDDGPGDDNGGAPDGNYVIGGTGVVKALTCCLKNRSDDSRRPSGDFAKDTETETDTETGDGSTTRTGLPSAGKAKDMSKHLLAGARKIRQRLQPALNKARSEDGDEMNLRKLVFLDETLQGIINRFEDEFPDTREPAGSHTTRAGNADGHELGKMLPAWTSEEPPLQAHNHTAGEDSAVVVSDADDETEMHPTKPLSRANSMLSRELAEEEGRVLRAGHRFRSGFVRKEQFDLISTIDDIGADAKHAQMLTDLAEDLGGELLEKVKEKGAVRAFKDDKDVLIRSMRDSDPDHWGRFLEAQQKARDNITAAASDKNTSLPGDESAIMD